jgi:hypothetical protein
LLILSKYLLPFAALTLKVQRAACLSRWRYIPKLAEGASIPNQQSDFGNQQFD